MKVKPDEDVLVACEDLLADLDVQLEACIENLNLSKIQTSALIDMYIASVSDKERFGWLFLENK